jgi:hypothetical protein
MDGKIEQRICIKFCVNPLLRDAFGEHFLSRTTVSE